MVREESLGELSVRAERKSIGTIGKFSQSIDWKVLFEKLPLFVFFEGHGQYSVYRGST